MKRQEERRKVTLCRRRGLWNAILSELRFRDRLNDDVSSGATDEIADLPSRRHLRDLIRHTIAGSYAAGRRARSLGRS